MHRIKINVQTGEQTIEELTPEEIAQAEAQQASWDLEEQNKPQLTPIQKLQAAGLTVEDLKQILGLP